MMRKSLKQSPVKDKCECGDRTPGLSDECFSRDIENIQCLVATTHAIGVNM